jgi:hypothetical protein
LFILFGIELYKINITRPHFSSSITYNCWNETIIVSCIYTYMMYNNSRGCQKKTVNCLTKIYTETLSSLSSETFFIPSSTHIFKSCSSDNSTITFLSILTRHLFHTRFRWNKVRMALKDKRQFFEEKTIIN